MVRGPRFFIPVPLGMAFAICIGGYVALDRWLRVSDERRERYTANLPKGFSALLASVAVSAVSLVVSMTAASWDAARTGMLHYILICVYLLLLLGSAALAGLAVHRAIHDPVRTLRFGTVILFIVDALCTVRFILELL